MLEFLLSVALFFAPLLIMASGCLCTELSGRVNMALEGEVLFGSFAAALVFRAGGGPLAALDIAAAATCILSALLSLSMDYFSTDSILAGLSANLIFQAAVSVIANSVFGSSGTVRIKGGFVTSEFGRTCLIAAVAAAFFALMWLFVSGTRPGLRMRATGSSLEASRSAGVNTFASRAIAFACSGLACGLAGGMLTFSLSAWSPGMTGGKGWIALAAMYVGGKRYAGIAGACLLFALAESAANLLQGQSAVPQEWSLAFPFVITLLFLALFPARGLAGKKGSTVAGRFRI